MALKPSFAAAPHVSSAQLSAANTARDGTGTVPIVMTAAASGTRIRAIHIKAIVTTTAGMVRLFLHDGANFHLWKEVPVTAITPSATVESFSLNMTEVTNPELLPLTIPTGWSLRAATEKAEAIRVIAEGANL
jgi:hypothetical protein